MSITNVNTFSSTEEIKEELTNLKEKGQAPEWMTINGLRTLLGGYLLSGETPKDMYKRVSRAAANRLNKPEMESKFYNILWKGWLGLATPVAANMGTERGLPISCYSSYTEDTINGIFETLKEIAVMSAKGGGTSIYLGDIRPKGAPISGGGFSNGVVPWMRIGDAAISRVSQGSSRRGALAYYLPADHADFLDFLKVRKPNTPADYHCPHIHQGACLSDEFMNRVLNKDKEARSIWLEILNTRLQTGEPYMLFTDTINRSVPDCYKKRGLKVVQSNLCSEIALHTDKDHSLVCCLSSLNVAKYDEWKNTELPYLAIYFLDAVMEEFIQKAKTFEGFERSLRFAEKSRALGLGVVGYHTYLQDHMIPFGSADARGFNIQLFKQIKASAEYASQCLAQEYGEPEWCVGSGKRNTHLLAVAPTVSNSIILGEVSPGIEPNTGGFFIKSTAKGSMPRYNSSLRNHLKEIGKHNPEVWQSVKDADGSVQHLDFLSDDAKEVFLTSREIDQLHIIYSASDRQHYLDQTQSVNLFFNSEVNSNYFNKIHLEAYKQGLHTLYYCRSEAVGKITQQVPSVAYEINTNTKDVVACPVCEG